MSYLMQMYKKERENNMKNRLRLRHIRKKF